MTAGAAPPPAAPPAGAQPTTAGPLLSPRAGAGLGQGRGEPRAANPPGSGSGRRGRRVPAAVARGVSAPSAPPGWRAAAPERPRCRRAGPARPGPPAGPRPKRGRGRSAQGDPGRPRGPQPCGCARPAPLSIPEDTRPGLHPGGRREETRTCRLFSDCFYTAHQTIGKKNRRK